MENALRKDSTLWPTKFSRLALNCSTRSYSETRRQSSNGRRRNWSCNFHKSVTEEKFAGRYVSKGAGTSESRNRISIATRPSVSDKTIVSSRLVLPDFSNYFVRGRSIFCQVKSVSVCGWKIECHLKWLSWATLLSAFRSVLHCDCGTAPPLPFHERILSIFNVLRAISQH